MYHHVLIDAGASSQRAGGPELAALLAGATRTLDEDARLCLEQLSSLLAANLAGRADAAVLADPGVRAKGGARGGLAGWQLRRVAAHVETHLHGPIFTTTLAGVAQLSTGHFCRAFKTSTGETPHGYVVRQRIRHAQRLMRETQDTLSQIACACGLSDQAHLTRLFRRLVGTTPLAWRRAWQQAG